MCVSFHKFNGDTLTIVKWTEKFKELYKETDKLRKSEEFWNAVLAHLSCIGEAIRKNHYPELLKAAASAFCWMCSFVSKCNDSDDIFKVHNSLPEIVGLKFPTVCGHCEHKPCICDPATIEATPDKSAKYGNLYKQGRDKHIVWNEYSLSDWLGVFHDIYGGRIHLQTMESLGFHLLEEAGEEAMAVRNLIQFRGILEQRIEGIDSEFLEKISKIDGLVEEYESTLKALKHKTGKSSDKEALKGIAYDSRDPVFIKTRVVKAKMDQIIELADTFSWFCATLLKLSYNIESLQHDENDIVKTGIKRAQLEVLHIEETLHERYSYKGTTEPLTCYACKSTPCKCLFFPQTFIT